VSDVASKAGGDVTRFWEKISLVAEISTHCRRQQPEDPSYEPVLELIQRIIPFDAATLYTVDRLTGQTTVQACLAEEVALPGFLALSAASLTGKTGFPRQPIVHSREASTKYFDDDGPYEATMVVPLLIDGAIIGVLNLGSYTPGVLSDRYLKLMSIVADQLAVSMDRLSRMAEIQAQHRALKKAHRQLRNNQRRIIDAEKLSAVVDLAASINHEINNPLSVIVGQVQCLMIESESFDDQVRERLRRVEQAALMIGEINRRLLKIDQDAPVPARAD
jgi:GAF domain-containing protein